MSVDSPSVKRQKTGLTGESLAADYLERQHYRILHRRYRCRYGEIDLIAEQNGMVVFVEVKTIRTLPGQTAFAEPEEKIHRRKALSLKRCADYYLSLHPDIPTCRVDLIAIRLSAKVADIRHLKNIMLDLD